MWGWGQPMDMAWHGMAWHGMAHQAWLRPDIERKQSIIKELVIVKLVWRFTCTMHQCCILVATSLVPIND